MILAGSCPTCKGSDVIKESHIPRGKLLRIDSELLHPYFCKDCQAYFYLSQMDPIEKAHLRAILEDEDWVIQKKKEDEAWLSKSRSKKTEDWVGGLDDFRRMWATGDDSVLKVGDDIPKEEPKEEETSKTSCSSGSCSDGSCS